MKIEFEFETTDELTALLAGTLLSLYTAVEAAFVLDSTKCQVNAVSPFAEAYRPPESVVA